MTLSEQITECGGAQLAAAKKLKALSHLTLGKDSRWIDVV